LYDVAFNTGDQEDKVTWALPAEATTPEGVSRVVDPPPSGVLPLSGELPELAAQKFTKNINKLMAKIFIFLNTIIFPTPPSF
jgi:hypothetical protein